MSEPTTELPTNLHEQFVDQHDEEIHDEPANGESEFIEETTENRNTRAPVLKVDLSGIKVAALNDSASVPQKTDYLEELNNREEEIRKMLYESSTSKQATDRTLPGVQSGKKVTYEVTKVIRPDSDDEECTFKPKINSKTSKLASKRQTQEGPVNVNLYKIAQEKKEKAREQEDELRQSISKTANQNKINPNSVKIILKRIETALRNLIADSESQNTAGKVSFENLGLILHRLGLFQNLEFQSTHTEDPANKSSVSVNQNKVKPQRLTREVAFHENFWKILAATSEDENLVPSETVFRFLMVLVEDKAAAGDSALFLKEVMDVGLESKGLTKQEGTYIYDQIKDEKQLWEMDKLVAEFRRLFTDKTSFMNIYASSGLLPHRATLDEGAQNSFKPQINAKSEKLALKRSTEGYQEKVKAAVQASLQNQNQSQDQSQSQVSQSRLENRYDILFEHHKLIKDKKLENSEAKLVQELASCTFKPTITEYKKAKNPNVDQSLNTSSMTYSQLSSQDTSKVKRHDLLYEVAKSQKEKKHQKAYEVKKAEEDKELAECTFQPRLHNIPADVSPTKQPQQEPKGYKKAIERLQVAEKLREERKAKEERIPRGENYEKIRNSEFKPPSFLNRPKIKKQEALVYVDVNIGPGKTGRIGIHKGDDAKVLARNFAKTYSLPSIMKESLEKLLQSYIDSYFPEESQREPEHPEVQVEGLEAQEEGEEEEEEEEEGEEEEGEEEEEEEEEAENNQGN